MSRPDRRYFIDMPDGVDSYFDKLFAEFLTAQTFGQAPLMESSNMKVETIFDTTVFKPVTIAITFETRADLELWNEMLKYDESIPKLMGIDIHNDRSLLVQMGILRREIKSHL